MNRLAAVLLMLFASHDPAPARAGTEAPGVSIAENGGWKDWLTANYPMKTDLRKNQSAALRKLVASAWDDGVSGDIFKDQTPGAIVVKFSPSGKTATRFLVLRWTNDGWKPLLRGGRTGVLDDAGAPLAPTTPVSVYQIYLQRKADALGFMITSGTEGDKFFGDVLDLSFTPRTGKYVWPDDSDHD